MGNDTIVIIGAAPCVHEDLAALPVDPGRVDYMAIGLDAVDVYPGRIEYVATYEKEDIPGIRERRAASGGNVDYKLISYKRGPGVDLIEPFPRFRNARSGSSAMCGVLYALRAGYKRIILCGCPLQGTNGAGLDYARFRIGWLQQKKNLVKKVRSMSGWTRELLGAPTEDWMTDLVAVDLALVYLSTEPEIPVVGGPLMRGYKLCLDGKVPQGRKVISKFLASVYVSRTDERSTLQYVHALAERRGIPRPASRAATPPGLVLEAAERRFDDLHFPLVQRIVSSGYVPGFGPPITMKKDAGGRYYVYDGKNRCSILAAMNATKIPNVMVTQC